MPIETTRADIRDAQRRIGSHIRMTPVLDLGPILDEDWRLVLKLDQLQPTGSFKVRGAFNLLLGNAAAGGVVAASGGNFGKAIAYAASRIGIPATIFVPESSPTVKTGRIAQFGADVRLVPGFYDDALEASIEYAGSSGQFLAHAFDLPDVIAGQGTIGAEILDQVPDASSILVPVGGGGLIGGIASWCRNEVRVVGVEPEGCPTLHGALAAGRPVKVSVGGVAASSLGASQLGENPWLATRWIGGSVLVDEAAILEARQWLWENTRLWVEPAASVVIAALRSGAFHPGRAETVVGALTGGNVALGVRGDGDG